MDSIKSFIFANILSLASLILSIFAIILAFIFWKNPIDNEFRTVKMVKDDSKNVYYKIGKKHKKWAIEKRLIENVDNGQPFIFIANGKNNPKINEAPENLEDLKKLTYDLEDN